MDQRNGDKWTPIAFFSRKLSKTERNYSTYDRELLAIYAAIKNFKHLLESRKFIIKTDHKPLTFAFQQKLDKASPRQIRRLDLISQFTTDIIHVKGDDDIVADALSRIETITMPTTLSPAAIDKAQEADKELPELMTNDVLKLKKFEIENSKIFCDISTDRIRPYIPADLRETAFNVVHGLAHPSGRTTAKALREKLIWPDISKDALRWSRECIACQRVKVQRHSKLLPNKIEVPDGRFNHIHLDFIHLSEVRGYKYCLTIIDRFSRFPMAIPLRDTTTETVVKALFDNWITLFGTPLTITTDQGPQFESVIFKAMANSICAKQIRTTPYHPASNGMIERWHRTLKAALMCNPEIPWIDRLQAVMLGLRTIYKEDLKDSSAEMLFGTTLRIPGNFFTTEDGATEPSKFMQQHKKMMRSMQPVQTTHHIKSKTYVHKELNKCSHVFIRQDHVIPPLTPPYTGPHKIIKRLDDRRYIMVIENEEKTISFDRLKPAFLPEDDIETNNEEKNQAPAKKIRKVHFKFESSQSRE